MNGKKSYYEYKNVFVFPNLKLTVQEKNHFYQLSFPQYLAFLCFVVVFI